MMLQLRFKMNKKTTEPRQREETSSQRRSRKHVHEPIRTRAQLQVAATDGLRFYFGGFSGPCINICSTSACSLGCFSFSQCIKTHTHSSEI